MGSPRTSVGVIFLPIVLLTLVVAVLCSSDDLTMNLEHSLEKELEWTPIPEGNDAPGESQVFLDNHILGASYAVPWPWKFTIDFFTRYGKCTGSIIYDWYKKRQLVIHGPNSGFCIEQGYNDACQMYEDPSGSYLYIPAKRKCILLADDIPGLPPNWVRNNSTYSGLATATLVGYKGLCKGYAFGPPTMHVWYETVVGALPCVFIMPIPNNTMFFTPGSFKVGINNDKYFAPINRFCLHKSETDSELEMVVE